jgi:hypothetical protein
MREVRMELFGVNGAPELARRMGMAARTWADLENGVTVPAEVVLLFLEVTGCVPHWLLTGEGPRYPHELPENGRAESRLANTRRQIEGPSPSRGDSARLAPSEEEEKAQRDGNRRELKAEIDRLRNQVAHALERHQPPPVRERPSLEELRSMSQQRRQSERRSEG